MYQSDSEFTNVMQLPLIDPEPMAPGEVAGAASNRGPHDASAGVADHGPWRHHLVGLLNGALATELVCMLRYRRHHFTAHGLASTMVADGFLAHAGQEAGHADRLAQRIVQLGGEPDFSPDTLARRSHAAYDEATDLRTMIRADLLAERIAIERYSQIVVLIGDRDPATRRLFDDIVADKRHHADELSGWLVD
jgi:bacterioferritin